MPHPACTGQGDANGYHCCNMGMNPDGTQKVCEFLVVDDPRAPDRHYACGIFLEIKDRFPNRDALWIWNRVLTDARYGERVKAYLDLKGIELCPTWRGEYRPDGTCVGQCCYRGWEWDANGNVIKQPGG